MKEVNGEIIIEVNDCIQVIKGPDIGTFGIVLSTQGSELLCWGRAPSSVPGAGSWTFKAQSYQCMHIGKGRIRPKAKSEEEKKPSGMPVAASRLQSGVQPPPEPRKAREQPRDNPEPPAPKPPPPEPATTQPQMGGAPDSEALDLKPKPRKGDDVDPKLLKPAVFAGPNAREIHGKPQHPEVLVPTEPQTQGAVDAEDSGTQQSGGEPAAAPAPAKTKKVSRRRKVRKTGGKRKQARRSLGIPLEGKGAVQGGEAVQQDGGQGQTDNAPVRPLPIG